MASAMRFCSMSMLSPLTPGPAMLTMKSALPREPSMKAMVPPSLWPSTPTLPNLSVLRA